ncbi:MAG TPA: MFS transporter [Candidatus Xenobia bacterium]|nr:MFS transporter [Candidatus Xenobia bacterium]
MASGGGEKNNPKTIFGWCMYDWANSAYATTVMVGLLPAYFAEVVVGREGATLGGTTYAADTLWAFTVGVATLIAFLTAPVLGAIADFSAARKRFLLSFAYTGCLFSLLLYFSQSGDVVQTLVFFTLAQVGFTGANVFYDSFLPRIASDDQMDWVSGKGFSYGYGGGGLQFALSLALVALHDWFGLTQAQAVRLGIVMAAVWWAAFSLFTVRYLKETDTAEPLPARYAAWPRTLAYAHIGVTRTLATTRRVGRFRHLAIFLLAFMLYDDAIQTVINLATVYGKVELELPTVYLLLTLLLVQAIASLGALMFSRLAGRIGTKRTIMLTLGLWSGVVVYAYFIQTTAQFFVLGAVVGIVLGGTQALSRSFYGSMVPEEASAEFYGFYTVFSKFAAMWGPWLFAIVKQATGSSRTAIVSLIALFLAGLILLLFVDEKKAREAKLAGAF